MRWTRPDYSNGAGRPGLNLLSVMVFASLMFVPQLHCETEARVPSPWSGTWKLDLARSSRAGSNFSIKLGPTGEYELVTASFIDRFRCNGEEYPLPGSGATITCNQHSPAVMDTVFRRNGKITGNAHRALSAHDMVMTSIANDVGPPPKTTKKVYRRLTGTVGFVGAWRDEHLLEDEPQILVTEMRERRLRISFPGKKAFEDLPLDASDSRVHGLSPGLNVTLAAEASGPLTIRTKKKVDGRLLEEGAITLSPDGQTLVNTFWEIAYPNVKSFFVYHRQ
jgi:hypothetical protein